MLLTALYAITLGYYIYRRYREIAGHGKVIDAKTKKPVAGAIIYVYDKKYNSLKTALTTDKYGRFSVYIPEGDYYLKVMSKNRNLTIRQTTKKFFRNMYNAGVIHLDNPHFLNYNIVVE